MVWWLLGDIFEIEDIDYYDNFILFKLAFEDFLLLLNENWLIYLDNAYLDLIFYY